LVFKFVMHPITDKLQLNLRSREADDISSVDVWSLFIKTSRLYRRLSRARQLRKKVDRYQAEMSAVVVRIVMATSVCFSTLPHMCQELLWSSSGYESLCVGLLMGFASGTCLLLRQVQNAVDIDAFTPEFRFPALMGLVIFFLTWIVTHFKVSTLVCCVTAALTLLCLTHMVTRNTGVVAGILILAFHLGNSVAVFFVILCFCVVFSLLLGIFVGLTTGKVVSTALAKFVLVRVPMAMHPENQHCADQSIFGLRGSLSVTMTCRERQAASMQTKPLTSVQCVVIGAFIGLFSLAWATPLHAAAVVLVSCLAHKRVAAWEATKNHLDMLYWTEHARDCVLECYREVMGEAEDMNIEQLKKMVRVVEERLELGTVFPNSPLQTLQRWFRPTEDADATFDLRAACGGWVLHLFGVGNDSIDGTTVFGSVFMSHQLYNWFDRFDFAGNGRLSPTEAQRLCIRVMHAYRKQNFGPIWNIDVPYGTPESRGYHFIRDLGKGGQGQLKLYQDESQNKCIKFYEKSNLNAGDASTMKEEFKLMKQLDSPNVARTYEIFQDSTFFYLVNEPYFGKDLTQVRALAEEHHVPIVERWWRDIFVQALAGVSFMHKHCIMHCDIKEANIMVANAVHTQEAIRKPHIVMIDFGMATAFGGEGGSGGTYLYMPPETLKTNIWFPTGDTWSMGITMLQLMTDLKKVALPGGHGKVVDLLNHIMEPQTNLPIDKLEGEKVRDLVKLMLRVDRTARTSRNARPTVTKCLHHEWFQEEAEENLAEDVIATLQSLPTTMTEAQSIVMEYLAERINLAQAHSVTQAFQAMDKDRSGFIDETEMRQILRDHDVGKEDEIVNGLLQHGVVTYSKFMEKMLAQEKLSDVNALHDVFTGLDKDGNEALDWTEVTELFQYIDPSSPTGHEIFDSMDTDEDGRVSWPEFRQALSLRSSTSELS